VGALKGRGFSHAATPPKNMSALQRLGYAPCAQRDPSG